MICIMLTKAVGMDPDESPLARASVKLKHPEPYSGGSDLKEFEGFIANILRWLKMNYLLGPTSMELQVSYMGALQAKPKSGSIETSNVSIARSETGPWKQWYKGCRNDSCTP
jgi:hypothetical protein